MTPLKWLVTVVQMVALPLAFLWLGDDWAWREGWIFAGWFGFVMVSTVAWLAWRDPGLLAERWRVTARDQARGDFGLTVLIMLGFVAWFALLPLDGHRWRWSPPLPLAVELAGGALLVPAWVFLFGALAANSFASPVVRVQTERAHRVVTTGVYRVVRHPMYFGAVLMFVGAPLLCGALSALAVGALEMLLLAARIGVEERMLAQKLDGYDDYRRRVRWRLLPFVW
jgi:protein-S-isoprenylcysteine O-methyltransferase Ste14